MGDESFSFPLIVFTSFQGGAGKSSIAWKFAQVFQTLTGFKGALIELNIFTPSFLVEHVNSGRELRAGLMDIYMSPWHTLTCQNLGNSFTEHDGLLLIPFTGARPKETLKPPFFSQGREFLPLLRHLITLLKKSGRFTVVDMPLSMTLLPLELISAADAVCYLYQTTPPSPASARRFLEEMERNLPPCVPKILFIKNFSDPETDNPALEPFEKEISLPISRGLGLDESDREFDVAFEDMVRRVLDFLKTEKIRNKVPSVDSSGKEAVQEYRRKLRALVVGALERDFGLSDAELRQKVEECIENAMKKVPAPVLDGIDVMAEARRYLLDEILGLGPLEEFIRDPEVTEIMVNGPDRIFIEKNGRMERTGKSFDSAEHVKAVIDRILIPVGRTVNERTPFVDARLPDGSRVHAIIPPLSLTGPMLTVRRFSREPFTLEELIYRFRTLTHEAAEFLKLAVRFKRNIIISGGASSGKTTLLNVLSSAIPESERIISIEDSAELRLKQENLGCLEARQYVIESRNVITIRDLLKNALRMRPDRIIVGECRGEEALDMLQAMNTGHDGSLTTLHANSTRDALRRLETMVLLAGADLPLRAIREQIASSINIVIHMARFSDGTRRVIEIAEITGIEDCSVKLETVFEFSNRWVSESGAVCGELVPTGYIPTFLKKIPGPLFEEASRLFERKVTAGGSGAAV